MKKNVLIGIIAAAAIILAVTAGYVLTRPSANDTVNDSTIDEPTSNQEVSEAPIDTSEATDMPVSAIAYTDSGFSPSPLTVKKGTAITITNNSSMDLMFASADHPAHQDNPELNLDAIKPGDSATVVITKTGTWGYHNHDSADHTGQIVVTE